MSSHYFYIILHTVPTIFFCHDILYYNFMLSGFIVILHIYNYRDLIQNFVFHIFLHFDLVLLENIIYVKINNSKIYKAVEFEFEYK